MTLVATPQCKVDYTLVPGICLHPWSQHLSTENGFPRPLARAAPMVLRPPRSLCRSRENNMDSKIVELRPKATRDAEIDACIDRLEELMKKRNPKWNRTLGAIDALIASAKSEVRALEMRRAEFIKSLS